MTSLSLVFYFVVGAILAAVMFAATQDQPVRNRLMLAGALVLFWPAAVLLVAVSAVSPAVKAAVLYYIEGRRS